MLFYDDLTHYIAGQRKRIDELQQWKIPELGVISKVLSPGPQQERKNDVAGYSVSHAVEALEVDAQGVIGDRHRGLSHRSGGRERALYPGGTIIRQHRHLCVVCSHDCKVLSEKLGVEVSPELLGANLVIDRADGEDFSLSELPHGTHLLVTPADAEEAARPPIATIVHFLKQKGCGITGSAIAERHGDKSLVRAFREHASHNRGIICSVEFPVQSTARLQAGQRVAFRFPMGVSP